MEKSIYCNSRFYSKTGWEVKCDIFSVIATSFALVYCNTCLRYIVSESVKIQCRLRYLNDFMKVSKDLSLNTVKPEMFLLVFGALFPQFNYGLI